jgi:hypothetical protein
MISSSLELLLVIPRSHHSNMFSLPVISPLKPVPTSSNDATRPPNLILPVVGAVTEIKF